MNLEIDEGDSLLVILNGSFFQFQLTCFFLNTCFRAILDKSFSIIAGDNLVRCVSLIGFLRVMKCRKELIDTSLFETVLICNLLNVLGGII